MADRPMDTYLNDHLAGAMFGAELARRLADENEGTRLGEVLSPIADEIEEDREALIDLMDRLGTTRNPAKQATTWLAEKASLVKFSGLSSGEPEIGRFMAIETLRLGVQGKECLWTTLKSVRAEYASLAELDLDALIERAASQRATLEAERESAGKAALATGVPA